MKVLHIIPSLVIGGAEKLLVDTISLYGAYSIDIEVLVLKKVDSFLEEELLSKGVKVSFIEGKRSLYSPMFIFKIIRYLRNNDIVHVHLFPTSYWVPLAKLISFSKSKLIFTEHSTYNKRRGKFVFRFLESFIYLLYERVICITEGTKSNLLKHLLFKDNKKFIVVNNGINVNIFKSVKYKDFGFFDEDDFKIIQVSSFRKEKDQITVLRSLSLLPDNIKLILVGEGVLKDNLMKLSIELGVKDRVKFLGNRNDVAQLMKYSDLVILSSNYEGFGIAALEGMATGKPTLASNILGVQEIVGGYGVLFKKGDADDLSKSILELYNNKDYYLEVASKCQERADEFDLKKTVERYIDIYKEI